jgi:HYR domain
VRRPALLGALGVCVLALLATASSWALAAPEKPTLTTATAVWTQQTTATFEFSSLDATSFECRLDGGGANWAACTSPLSFPSVPEGSHTFQVRAYASGEQSPPTTFEWTVDVTAPTLPGDTVAEATSPAGAIVGLAAADNLDPTPVLACSPAPGTVFPLGSTAVTCTATDAAGNATNGDLTITVRDTTPPSLAPHPDVVVGQQSPQGAVVNYTSPAATDLADPSPEVACQPASGTTFPLGETQVSCVAEDAEGLTSPTETFTVIVQAGPTPAKPGINTTVPHLTNRASAEFDLDAQTGLTVECRLDGPLGTGSFSPCSADTPQSYSGLVDGTYLFTVQVTNSIGNVNQASYGWTVDRTAPAPVARFSARPGFRRVALSWTKPIDADYDRVRVWRKRGATGSWIPLVDRVTAASFTDTTVANHVFYRYRIASLDRAGNASPVGEVTAWPSPILSPRYGQVVHSPPLVDWRPVRRATYYNMQLWRGGKKILSVWPLTSQYRLRSSWTFKGKRHVLSDGQVSVFVWAGFGPKAAVRYGPLYGRTVFRVG